MTKIDTVESRTKLKTRQEPYWQRISAGCYLGFRKMTSKSIGTWIAVYRDSDSGKKIKHSLGDFADIPSFQRFDAASKSARAWFDHLSRRGSREILTVREACEKWIDHKRNVKNSKSAADAEARFIRWVYNSKIANIPLNKLTRNHIDVWRATMTSTDVIINPHAKNQLKRQRSPATVNRDMSELRAALNFAHDNNWITDDSSWRLSLRAIRNADKRRNTYLDKQQRQALIEHAEPEFAVFLKALCYLPLRPGAMADLRVENFDPRLATLTIGKDKQGFDRKILLPKRTSEMFAIQGRNKSGSDFLFTRFDGKPWERDTWKKLFKKASKLAGLTESATTYTLRHSVITDLIFLEGLDLLTTAMISGTSVAMIERHYGHLIHEHAAKALDKLVM